MIGRDGAPTRCLGPIYPHRDGPTEEALDGLALFGLLDITASAHHSIFVRTTINLDDDVGRAARELARTSGKRLGQVVSELARRGLKARAELGRKGGFPTFRVGAEAEIIPADRARKLLEDDSL